MRWIILMAATGMLTACGESGSSETVGEPVTPAPASNTAPDTPIPAPAPVAPPVAVEPVDLSYLPMPYSLKAMNFTFSGLQTYAEKLIGKYPKNDIAYSLMETSFSMICEGVEKALTITGKKELIACGGVACNKRLQEMLSLLATDRGITFGAPSPEFNVDNGAMVAFTGAKLLECGFRPETGEIAINQDYRIDQAKLPKNF